MCAHVMAAVMAGLAVRRPEVGADGGPGTARPDDTLIPPGGARNNALSSLLTQGSTNHTDQHEALRWEAGADISRSTTMYRHGTCPSAEGPHCWTAHVVADHSEQGWMRLCNGVILFDDGFFIAPDGHSEPVVLAA